MRTSSGRAPELRDAEKRYNKFAAADLSRLGSRFDWPQFFRGVGGESIDELIVTTPSYFEGLDAIFAETPLETWKQYLKFKLIDDYAPLLSPRWPMLISICISGRWGASPSRSRGGGEGSS